MFIAFPLEWNVPVRAWPDGAAAQPRVFPFVCAQLQLALAVTPTTKMVRDEEMKTRSGTNEMETLTWQYVVNAIVVCRGPMQHAFHIRIDVILPH